MKSAQTLIFAFMMVLTATLIIAGCSPMPIREWPALNGKVLDANTEKPIEGAYVVAIWEGYGGHNKSCFHVEAVTTDNQGIFKIPEWYNTNEGTVRLGSQYRHVSVVYKNGDQWSDRNYREQSQLKGIYYLEEYLGPVNNRLKYLSKLTQTTGCGKSDRNLHTLFMAMHSEAITIASTPKEKDLAKNLRYRAEALLDSVDFSRPIRIPKDVNRALPAQDPKKPETVR